MKINNYEAMFLLESNAAAEDFDGTSSVVDQILGKHGAEIVNKEKWDERKLAYEIKGQRRATYYLVYFSAPTAAIRDINEDVRLSEVILRHLVVRLDEPIRTHIEKRDKERELLAEDSRKNSIGGWGERRKERKPSPRSQMKEGAPAEKEAAPAVASKTEAEPAPAGDTAKPEADSATTKTETPKQQAPTEA